MKNKKSLYYLIPLVLIVWGAIIYRVFKGAADDSGVYNFVTSQSKTANSVKSDSIIPLKLKYSDPFLKFKINPQRRTSAPIKRNENKINMRRSAGLSKKTQLPIKIEWPSVSFFGIVSDNEETTQVGLLQVNNHSGLVKEEDLFNELMVKKIYRDSIVLVYKKEKKTFNKN